MQVGPDVACDPDREQYVLTRLQDINTGPLDDRAVYKLFRRIIRESRRIQTNAAPAGELVSNVYVLKGKKS